MYIYLKICVAKRWQQYISYIILKFTIKMINVQVLVHSKKKSQIEVPKKVLGSLFFFFLECDLLGEICIQLL